MSVDDDDPPFDHGSQPVVERPTEPPGTGSAISQTIIYIIGAVVLIAALLWLLVPIL